MMTRKDYIRLAEVFASTAPTFPSRDVRMAQQAHATLLAERMADMLARDNPRFDRGRFLAACAPQGGVPLPAADAPRRCPAGTCLQHEPCCHPDPTAEVRA